MNILIRPEYKSDFDQIKTLNVKAFGQDDEARIIERLRSEKEYLPNLSLVAEHKSSIIGHIMLSSIRIGNNPEGLVALAPMAVLPEFQNCGIGSQLVLNAITEAKKSGQVAIVVLGHPNFYPKFGFERASLKGITCPFDGVPDEAFMVLELFENSLDSISGMVSYSNAFSPTT